MKKIVLLVSILATMFSGSTFAQTLVASDVTFVGDATEEKVIFSLDGFSTPVPAIAQFVVTLPDGFSLKEGRRGFEYDVKGPGETGIAMDHAVTIFQRENGDYYVLLSDNSGYEFYEANGYLISLTVKMEEGVAEGSYPADIKEIVIDDVTGKVHLVSASEGSFNITVGGSTVGIRDMRANGEDGKIYNTAGQRVVKAGKGLYIQNGKKVVKK